MRTSIVSSYWPGANSEIAVSDGTQSVALRYTTDDPKHASSLYVHTGRKYVCDGNICRMVDPEKGTVVNNAVILIQGDTIKQKGISLFTIAIHERTSAASVGLGGRKTRRIRCNGTWHQECQLLKAASI